MEKLPFWCCTANPADLLVRHIDTAKVNPRKLRLLFPTATTVFSFQNLTIAINSPADTRTDEKDIIIATGKLCWGGNPPIAIAINTHFLPLFI
ncbi:MAG: hypothetical protein QNJ72_15515 [Pleurocapsa sp. MO_226.B13]|nr:hypothetical protein [Pleurocapsa sp. MO_226.B13]